MEVTLELNVESARVRAQAMLLRFVDPALVDKRLEMLLALRPGPEDYGRVFAPEIAESLRAGYEAMWQTPPPWRVRSDQTVLRVAAATVAELRSGTAGARAFPGGYRDVVPHMRDGHIWLVWEYLAPTSSAGMAFDGLVALDDRWAWFPKPWRMLPRRKPRIASHYAE